ncbi:MAG: carbamate kinase [Candidatus Methanofastidiosia archaeon]
MDGKLILVALGGNAILKKRDSGSYEDQLKNVRKTCKSLAGLMEAGYRLLITHGNGPQIGNILLQNDVAKHIVPPMSMDVCGAQSQGLIGYMIQQSLQNEFSRRGIKTSVATLITQVLVDEKDEAFKNPTKPIGPFYEREEAERLEREKGYHITEDSGRGYRRVVPSPKPKKIVEAECIKKLLKKGFVVIASGGGGIPVVRKNKILIGVEAVIDKDLAGERLAEEVGANILLCLTDVERVYLNYGKPNQKPIDKMSLKEAERYIREGHFGKGSMEPKIIASIRFIKDGGERAIISSLDKAPSSLRGKAGTTIERF